MRTTVCFLAVTALTVITGAQITPANHVSWRVVSAMGSIGAVGVSGASNTEQEVLTANRLYSEAVGKNDLDTVRRYFADDYIFIDRLGRVWTKAQQVENFKTQALVYERLTEDDIRVKVYGSAAVVTGRTDQRLRFRGELLEGRTRYTRVFVKRNGRWQIVAHQRTDIAVPNTGALN